MSVDVLTMIIVLMDVIMTWSRPMVSDTTHCDILSYYHVSIISISISATKPMSSSPFIRLDARMKHKPSKSKS